MDKDNAWEGFYAEGYENGYQAGMEEKKPWVNLTEEEISTVDWKSNETLHDFAKAIEAKLREKNGG